MANCHLTNFRDIREEIIRGQGVQTECVRWQLPAFQRCGDFFIRKNSPRGRDIPVYNIIMVLTFTPRFLIENITAIILITARPAHQVPIKIQFGTYKGA
jgi:hypothetical protein